mmetsp:Transcript_13380/g.19529  ORF Transcript_13380/g.19529 Transcript_13380/m.19529 type:complete len:86 (-) Transcript_13380:1155-1412(-)
MEIKPQCLRVKVPTGFEDGVKVGIGDGRATRCKGGEKGQVTESLDMKKGYKFNRWRIMLISRTLWGGYQIKKTQMEIASMRYPNL